VWNVLDEVISHPWQVLARNLFVITAVEEAVVELMELLMTLKEVNNFITYLRNIEVV